MHYRNKRPLPIYNKPNEQIVRANVPTVDNIQMTSTGSRGLDGPIDDEVIYSKPSFENNSSSQTRNYELSYRRPKSFQSATSSTSKPDDNWEPEADRQAKQNLNAQPVRTSSQDYLKKANAVYQNEDFRSSLHPNYRYEFQSPSLSRQSSAFSSYSRQKEDTLV